MNTVDKFFGVVIAALVVAAIIYSFRPNSKAPAVIKGISNLFTGLVKAAVSAGNTSS